MITASELTAFINILKKDIKSYYLKPPNISWGLIFPFAWMLMFLIRSEGHLEIIDVFPGVIAISILFGTTSMLAVTITFEKRSRSFERLLLAPIDLNLLMLSKTMGAILFGMINAILPILIISYFIEVSATNLALILGSVLLSAVSCTFLGLFIAVSVKEVFQAQTYSNFFRFPMMFLCGLFVPVFELPLIIRPLSYILPLTYGVDILREAINQTGHLPIWINFIVLLLFCIALFLYSIKNVKYKWID
ncbi:ABC transporter permease [Natranaerobius thermophilus]|uniref:Transport permease protein n=1 Tax=Natranaerobius thermophilus (strain ATCC BAA-1301 / DSM 18059 / JW/NM-WN-LF) TaxID=457570 RepID=B2A0L0_NATTJ|nr:ABC transporter permease [Natranaerobius thermophilus]ACB84571.1 ABC-2 type transporter [Natranaerobius thermophilus JW/NM-WN-LF]